MNDIVFLNDHWTWPVLIAALVLLLLFLAKEWIQAGSRRIVLKTVLSILAITALALIALKPAVPEPGTNGKIVLLTPGYNSATLDSLKKENKNIEIEEYTPGNQISDKIKTAEEIIVLGYGVKEYDLWQLENLPVSFPGSNSPEGIVRLKYESEKRVGDSLVLAGLYKNTPAGHRLVLQGPGGAGLDSVIFVAEENRHFELKAHLRVQGNYLYNLTEKDSLGAVLSNNVTPIKVVEKTPLKVLMVNSYPIFETKYLKNFLAEAGHKVVVRSQVTRGRYKYEYFNTNPTTLTSLTGNVLESFDLLIIDAAGLRSLTPGETNALEQSVREEGLGIFVQPDASYFSGGGKFSVFDFERTQGNEVALEKGVIVEKEPYRIKEEFGLQTLSEKSGLILSAYQRMGQGRIGTAVFSNTYQLLLDGSHDAYYRLWSQILEGIGRKETVGAAWELHTPLIYPDEPYSFSLRTQRPEPRVTNGAGNNIPLRQDVNIATLWHGTTWPEESGWNSLQLDTTTVYNYYVSEEDTSNGLATFNTFTANSRHFGEEGKTGTVRPFLAPVNPLWFLAIFLVCMGGLWLEPKI